MPRTDVANRSCCAQLRQGTFVNVTRTQQAIPLRCRCANADEGDIGSALLRVTAATGKKLTTGIAAELASMSDAVKKVPWTQLETLKGDPNLLKQIEEAESLLEGLRKTLST